MTYTLIRRREAAYRLGIGDTYAAARVLERRIRQVEAQHGIEILERGPRGAPTLVRWELAAEYLLQPQRNHSNVDALRGQQWREFVRKIDQRIADGADRRIDQRVIPRLEALQERDEIVAKAVRELAQRMVSLTKT